jgi:hypothetical protein
MDDKGWEGRGDVPGWHLKRLFAFSSLMPRTGQEFSMLVFAHFLAPFLDYATQQITPSLLFSYYIN